MERDARSHDYVELVGGPLDGHKLEETKDSVRFEHNTAQIYEIDGNNYRPYKVIKNGTKKVLIMNYIGKPTYTVVKKKRNK